MKTTFGAEWQAYRVFAHYVAMESYMSKISTKFECHVHHSQVQQVAFKATPTPFPALMGGPCIRHVSQCSFDRSAVVRGQLRCSSILS